MTSHAQTNHIRICREAWHEHLKTCRICLASNWPRISPPSFLCESGQIAYGEYISSITANRDVEHLEATDAPSRTK